VELPGIETMSRTILSEIDGFTPLPDLLVKRYGLFTAAVFGRMWRYCQMQDGVCRASLDSIAKDLNVSKMTIIRHVETLVYDGFLRDTTPDRKNKPHVYADTGKVAMYNKFGMKLTITESNSENSTLTESDSALTESDSQSHRELLEDSKKKELKKENLSPPAKANAIPEVLLFREVTKRYPNAANFEDVVLSVTKVSARLGRDVVRDDLLPFYKAWTAKGYNPSAISWLEWAESGQIPVNGTWKSSKQPKAFEPVQLSPERLEELRKEAQRALMGDV
jgi:DNA-binding Lrp family transcriptional regulator